VLLKISKMLLVNLWSFLHNYLIHTFFAWYISLIIAFTIMPFSNETSLLTWHLKLFPTVFFESAFFDDNLLSYVFWSIYQAYAFIIKLVWMSKYTKLFKCNTLSRWIKLNELNFQKCKKSITRWCISLNW
jgi:hypothetical protein